MGVSCIILGYYEQPVDSESRQAVELQDSTGAWRFLRTSTVSYQGERLRYTDFFARRLQEIGGGSAELHSANMPNLAAHYLTSFLRRAGIETELVNFVNAERDQLISLLADTPHLVAITTTYYFAPEPIKELVALIRAHASEKTRIVVGGPFVVRLCQDLSHGMEDSVMRSIGADYFIHESQGELTLARLAQTLRDGGDIGAVPNLIYDASEKRLTRTPRAPEANSLDENHVRWKGLSRHVGPVAVTRTARGCAYSCSFCRYPIFAGKLTHASLETIQAEFDTLHEMGVTHLQIVDDTFNIPRQRFKDICRLMIRQNYGFRWVSYFRCAQADQETFDLMAAAGCTGVFLGIESADPEVLEAMNKGATADQYRLGIAGLKQRGILTFASIIIGFPRETVASARTTIDFIKETQPDWYCIEPYYHHPFAPIGKRSKEFGIKGRAYMWSHDTMDWRQCLDLVEEGTVDIADNTEADVLPVYGFSLWSAHYLMGHGYSREQVRGLVRVASTMVCDELAGRTPTIDPRVEIGALISPTATSQGETRP